MWRFLALVLLPISAAHADTYRWVDAKGVVNYSNSPPPAMATGKSTVADRISTYETDSALKVAAAQRGPSWYEQQAATEWLQRQRLMAASQVPAVDPYAYERADAYAPYYYPATVFVGRRVHVSRRSGPHRR